LNLSKKYPAIFRTKTIVESISAFESQPGAKEDAVFSGARTLTVTMDEGEWHLDTLDEFLSYHSQSDGMCHLSLHWTDASFLLISTESGTRINVSSSSQRFIRSIFAIFEAAIDNGETVSLESEPVKPKPIVFIAHGGKSQQWRLLKDHLMELHSVSVEAFESGARAGHAIRDILHALSARANFAIIVMTAEDEMADGGVRARQNVIHEAGLFQGRLGFARAIVLRECGTETFSNIDGIQRIEFSKDNIRETFGEVLATIRREFGSI
jgi:hypothetical protein